MDDLLVLITGGTICRTYNPRSGGFAHDSKIVTEYLRKLNLSWKPHYLATQGADSRNFTREDRIDLWNMCEKEYESRILIIHGTDTMCETARLFLEQDLGKTVVFTGAFYPLSYGFSDAEFNLGFGMASALHKDKGIYIAMNGQCLDAATAVKDWDRLQFNSNES